jgi:hypothetical protein
MAGGILFYAIALGKGCFATWWCNWCQLFENGMASSRSSSCIPWNMESLKAHALRLESGAVN